MDSLLLSDWLTESCPCDVPLPVSSLIPHFSVEDNPLLSVSVDSLPLYESVFQECDGICNSCTTSMTRLSIPLLLELEDLISLFLDLDVDDSLLKVD